MLARAIATPCITAVKPNSLRWKLANKLVYSKVREAFGGRVRIFVSGGAPLGIDTAQVVRVGRALRSGKAMALPKLRR